MRSAALHKATPAPASGIRALLRGTGWQSVSQFLPLVVNLLLTPYIIHGLGLERYGIFLIASSVQAVFGTMDGGIGESANRFFAVYAGRGEAARTTRLLVSLLTIVAVSAVVLCGTLFAVAPAIVDFFPTTQAYRDGSILLMRTMVALIMLGQLRGLFLQLLYVHNRFAVVSSAYLLGHVVYTIGMVWTIRSGAGLTGIARTFAAQMALGAVVMVVGALRHLTWAGVRPAPRALLREFFGYSWKVQVAGLVDMLQLEGDLLIAGRLASGQLTPYGAGANFAGTLRTLAMSASMPIFAQLGRWYGEKGEEDAGVEADKLQRLWVIGIAGYVGVGAPAAYAGVNAWLHLGTDLPGVTAALILVAYGFWLTTMITMMWALVCGRSGLPLRFGLTNLVMNLTLTVVLIVRFGVVGSAVATLVAQAVACLLFVGWAGRGLARPLMSPWRHIPVAALAAGIGCSLATQWLVSTFLVPNLVPVGPAALLLHGLAAVVPLCVYVQLAVGVGQLRISIRESRLSS